MGLKIALFHNLPSGGAKRHTFEQVRELARRGHDIVEFAPTTADAAFFSLGPYVRQQRFYAYDPGLRFDRRIPFLTPYLNVARGLEALRRTRELNRVIASDIDAGNFEVVLAKDCRIAFKPYVLRYLHTRSAFQCHHALAHKVHPPVDGQQSLIARARTAYYSPATKYYQWCFDRDEARNVRGASRVLTSSRFTQSVLADRFGVVSHVIYPGIDTSVFRPGDGICSNYVLSVGALTYQKGHRFVVSALARIPVPKRPPLKIVANSTEPAEEAAVRTLAARAGVEVSVEKINDDTCLAEAYRGAIAFAFAPINEALGMAPLEAAACGTPVVAVAEGGVQETMQQGVTGWLVERDEQAFADRVHALICDRTMRRQVGETATTHVRENWTWPAAVNRLERQLQRGI